MILEKLEEESEGCEQLKRRKAQNTRPSQPSVNKSPKKTSLGFEKIRHFLLLGVCLVEGSVHPHGYRKLIEVPIFPHLVHHGR